MTINVALRCNHILMKKKSIISSLAMYEAQFTQNSLSDLSFYWPMWQICMTKLHEPSVKSLTKFQMWICIGITRFQPQNLMKVNLTAPLDIQNLNFLLNDSLKKAMQTVPGSHSTAKFWFYRSISMVVGRNLRLNCTVKVFLCGFRLKLSV